MFRGFWGFIPFLFTTIWGDFPTGVNNSPRFRPFSIVSVRFLDVSQGWKRNFSKDLENNGTEWTYSTLEVLSNYLHIFFTTGIKPECEMKINNLQSHPASASMVLQEHIFITFSSQNPCFSSCLLHDMGLAPRAQKPMAQSNDWCTGAGCTLCKYAGNVSLPDLQSN